MLQTRSVRIATLLYVAQRGWKNVDHLTSRYSAHLERIVQTHPSWTSVIGSLQLLVVLMVSSMLFDGP